MNKLTKSAIAGAAGIALLLGGAGSLALWNDSTIIGGADITSGTLTIDEVASAGSWSSTVPTLWVPGDSAEYTTQIKIGATGDNLKALLSVNPGSITGDLATALVYGITVASPPTGVTAVGTTGTYEITSAADGKTLDVTVTVKFPDSVTGTTAQNQTVDLSGLNFLLQQHL